MRIEEAAARGAAKARPGGDVSFVGKDMPANKLLLTVLSAPLAPELLVELISGSDRRSEHVFVPFEEFSSNLGVELLEHRHPTQVPRVGD